MGVKRTRTLPVEPHGRIIKVYCQVAVVRGRTECMMYNFRQHTNTQIYLLICSNQWLPKVSNFATVAHLSFEFYTMNVSYLFKIKFLKERFFCMPELKSYLAPFSLGDLRQVTHHLLPGLNSPPISQMSHSSEGHCEYKLRESSACLFMA